MTKMPGFNSIYPVLNYFMWRQKKNIIEKQAMRFTACWAIQFSIQSLLSYVQKAYLTRQSSMCYFHLPVNKRSIFQKMENAGTRT